MKKRLKCKRASSAMQRKGLSQAHNYDNVLGQAPLLMIIRLRYERKKLWEGNNWVPGLILQSLKDKVLPLTVFCASLLVLNFWVEKLSTTDKHISYNLFTKGVRIRS